jgi:hypothetical protein
VRPNEPIIHGGGWVEKTVVAKWRARRLGLLLSCGLPLQGLAFVGFVAPPNWLRLPAVAYTVAFAALFVAWVGLLWAERPTARTVRVRRSGAEVEQSLR